MPILVVVTFGDLSFWPTPPLPIDQKHPAAPRRFSQSSISALRAFAAALYEGN